MPRQRAPSVSSSSRSSSSYSSPSRSSSPASSYGSVASAARSSSVSTIGSDALEEEVERGRAELDIKLRHIQKQEKRQAALESRYGAKMTEREAENEERRAELARKKEAEARKREEEFEELARKREEIARQREAKVLAIERERNVKRIQDAEEQRNASAAKLQAMYRGKLARRELDNVKTKKKAHEANAAKERQRRMRKANLQKQRLQLQQEEKKQLEEEMRQLWFAELKLKKRHDAIRLIQGRVKGILARKQVRAMKEARAKEIEIRSAAFRDKQEREARDRHLRKVEAERQRIVAERQYQYSLERELQLGEWRKLAERSATRIQAAFRGRSDRRGVAMYKEKLQADERKRLQERSRAEVKRKLEIHEQKEQERRQKEERAAVVIQTRYRGLAAREQVSQTKAQRLAAQRQREIDRQKEALRRRLAEQERLRVEQERLRAEAEAREAAAIKIQARARSKVASKEVQAMRLEKRERLERLERERLELAASQEEAATKLQAGFRGKAARTRTAELKGERRRRLEEEEKQRQFEEWQRLEYTKQRQEEERLKREEQEKLWLEFLEWQNRPRGASLSGAGSLGITLKSPVKQRIGGCGPVGGYQASTTRSRSKPSGSLTGGGLLRTELTGGQDTGGHLPSSIPLQGPRRAQSSAPRTANAVSHSGPTGAVRSGAGGGGPAGLLAEADRGVRTKLEDTGGPRSIAVDTGAVRSRGRGGPAGLALEADLALRMKLEAMGQRFRADALERAQKLDAPASILGEALGRAQKLDAPVSMLGDQRLR